MTSLDERTEHSDPPQDLAAEQSVLGALLLSKRATDVPTAVLRLLQPQHFFKPAHQTIYTCIRDQYEQAQPVDAITVCYELERRQQLLGVGGAPYLHTLLDTVPTAANADYYAQIVADKADLRLLRDSGALFQRLADSNGDVLSTLESARDRLCERIDALSSTSTDDETVGDLQNEFLEHLNRVAAGEDKGIPTGFTDLDNVTNGLHAGQLITIAARPGIGKSGLALDMARSAAVQHGYPTLMFSLEMSRMELMERFYAAEARVRSGDMRSGKMTDEDWSRLARRVGETHEVPLYINDEPNLTVTDIRAQSRRMQQQHDIRLVVVDYMQLVTGSGTGERREQEVSEISRGLKLLGKELGVPVVAVAQLNRGPEQRTDKKPQLGDLRESGSIENDSDMVILIHRPDATERDDPRMGEADLILAKNRSGPQATITVAHQLHYSRFVNLAPE